MRFPLLWIAGAFSAGVALAEARFPSLPALLLACALILASCLFLMRRSALRLAWCTGLALWVGLGIATAQVDALELPVQHVTRLAQTGMLEPKEPLRWRGILRSDPLRLPYGLRYEIALDEVHIAGRAHPVTGGLRVNYFRTPQQPEPEPPVRAGDRVEALVRARPPRNFKNPGAFDVRAQLSRLDIHLTGSLRSLELLQRIGSPPPALSHRAARVRAYLLTRLNSLFDGKPAQAAVLRAILLGDSTFIDHELAQAFQETSAYHVLVISGLHVAALASLVFWLGRRLRFSLLANSVLTLIALGLFLALIENRPPIERASWVAVVVLAAGLLFRRVQLLNTLGAVVLLMLVMQPPALSDSSFQLSFVAAAMIGALGLPLVERSSAPCRKALAHLSDVTRDAGHAPRVAQFRLDMRAASSWLASPAPVRLQGFAAHAPAALARFALALWEVFLVSTVIQIGMLPILAHYFHRVSLAGPLANIPAVILSTILLPLGLLTLLMDTLLPALAPVFAAATSFVTGALLASVEWFAQWQRASYRIPGPPAWLSGAFLLALAALSCALFFTPRETRRWFMAALLLPVAISGIAICVFPFHPNLPAGQVELTVLDVGQGDSLFLSFPNGQTLLFDGGGPSGASRHKGQRMGLDVGDQVVSPYLWSRGLQRIDVLALSHAHQDHLDGLLSIMDNFQVRELWVSREIRSPAFTALIAKALQKNVAVKYRTRGESFAFGEVRGLVLWPEHPQPIAAASNNDSLVLRLEFGAHAFLLPGDIESVVEQELFAREDPLAADFLKVPHHASRTSTSPDFALAVLPRIAVMSFGENNPFGHPHQHVLDALAAMGADSYRTDRDGAVTIVTDGKNFSVRSHAAALARKGSE